MAANQEFCELTLGSPRSKGSAFLTRFSQQRGVTVHANAGIEVWKRVKRFSGRTSFMSALAASCEKYSSRNEDNRMLSNRRTKAMSPLYRGAALLYRFDVLHNYDLSGGLTALWDCGSA